MNTDYLWDGTGEDKEIETLEELLGTLNFRNNLSPKFLAPDVGPSRRKRHFIPAVSGATAMGILLAFAAASLMVQTSPQHLAGLKAALEGSVQTQLAAPRSEPVPTGFSARPQRAVYGPAPPRTKRSKRSVQARDLTPDERYAYDQLLTALSITGSKLQMIQNAVDNNERKPEATSFK